MEGRTVMDIVANQILPWYLYPALISPHSLFSQCHRVVVKNLLWRYLLSPRFPRVYEDK